MITAAAEKTQHMRRWRWLALGAIWLSFVVRGVFYSSAIPLWEGWDEYAHFAYVQQLALHHTLPRLTEPMSEEIDRSLRLAPMAQAVVREEPALATHDAWWQLPAQERQRLEQRLRRLDPALSRVAAASLRRQYEAQQPPLAYVVLAPLYRMTEGQPLLVRVWVLRIFDVLIAALSIPLAYAIVFRVSKSVKWSLAAAALVASFPEFLLSAARVSNEPVASAMGGLVLLLTLGLLAKPAPRWWDGAGLGAAVGLAVLAKVYLLTLLPAVVLVLVLARRTRQGAAQAALVLAAAGAVAGWWMWRNWLTTGTVTGLGVVAWAQARGEGGLLAAGARLSWWRVLDGMIATHAWCANWSFLEARSWMYRVYAAGAAAILAAAAVEVVRKKPGSGEVRRGALVAAVLLAAVTGALLYHSLLLFRLTGDAIGIAWYLYGMVAAEATLAAIGLRRLAMLPGGWLAGPVAVGCLTLLDLFGANALMLPYYAGLTRRNAGGAVRAFDLRTAGWETIERASANLAVNKPAFLTPEVIRWLWAASVAAALALVAVAIVVARRKEPAADMTV